MGFDESQKGLIRQIFAIAIPAIVINITTPLLGLCDVAIAGHKGGAAIIAALAVGTSMFNMIYWIFGFLRMGVSGLTARAFGASDSKEESLILSRALFLGVTIGLLIVALQSPIGELLLWSMDVSGSMSNLAREYFEIVVWGAPAVLGTYSLTGWFIGMQSTRIPMTVSIATDLMNIIVSVTLVFIFDMNLKGVAFGTLTAQWLSFFLGCIYVRCKFDYHRQTIREILRLDDLLYFFKINGDIFIRTICLVAVTMWFTRVGAEQGPLMLAVNALIMQLFTLCSYFMDGFAFSSEAIVGKFIGAGDNRCLTQVIWLELRVSAVVAIIFSGIYLIGAESLISVLTDDRDVVNAAHDYLPWAISLPLAGFLAFSCDGIAIGATATRIMLFSMTAAMALFFSLYFLLFPMFGNHGLWIAFLSYLLARGVLLLYLIRRHLRVTIFDRDGGAQA